MGKDFWAENAEPWTSVIDSMAIKSREITNPAILDLIVKSKTKSLLDVGCGEGWIARALPADIKYFGIDGSAQLIDIAKSRSAANFQHVTYDEIANQSWKCDQKFHGIVFNFSLLDEHLTALLKGITKFLEPQGTIHIQTIHPCFKLPGYKDAWISDDFKTTSVSFKGSMPWFGRTLSSWIQTFTASGLYLHELTEPSKTELPTSIIFSLKPRQS